MKKRRILLSVFLVVLLILSGFFFYSCYNGFVFIDDKFVTKIHLDYSDDTEQLLIPVVATLTEMGYAKTSDANDVIELQNEDQVLTLDLDKQSLTCPQLPINCLESLLRNTRHYCMRKGRELFVDTATFSSMLACIDCKYMITLAHPKLRIIKFTYSEKIEYSQLLKEHLETIPEEAPKEDTVDIITEARLIVNGLDITEGNHVFIHHGHKNAEIPMLAILRALGYDAKMQYDEKREIYESVIGEQIGFFSTAYEDFDIPFSIGEKGCVRKIENNDFIVDYKCIYTQMYWFFGAQITVDFDTSTIYVNSCDPWA